MTRLLLVRHGQTTSNLAGRVQGHSESDLTELGVAQARSTADALRDRGIERMYSSDLGRAQRTAGIIGARLGLESVLDPRLREVCFGGLEGRTWAELDTHFRDAEARGEGNWFTHVPPGPGGESRQGMQRRAVDTLTSICRRHPEQTVLVVSHGGFIGFFMRWVLGVQSKERYAGFRTPNCAIHTFEWREKAFHLLTWAERAHLDGGLFREHQG
ncbi:MAG: histidine phosphatase family protein [Myxococcota bacterium]